MKYTINKSSSSPAYLQLYYQLRDDIIQQIYPYGSKLPSKRLLSDETGLSLITIEHTYALLCEEGYAESRERSGYYVSFHVGENFSAPATFSPALTCVAPSSSSTHSLSYPLLARTMRKVLSDYGETILEKAPNGGFPVLREEIRKYRGTRS